uniref:transmembrane emp24 domain-containing protein 10-like n=1 Tax=Scatophagus argus TaxID=75038 RepID=UPI001ED7DBBB|nr:transmembrane emp24 domain-containing protein 10-like [Scatophagus argus]
MSRLCVYLLIPVLSDLVFAIQFHLPVNSEKCLQDNIRENALVIGEYEVSQQPETKTRLQITGAFGFMLYTKNNATKGKFSFTADNQDQYYICFYSRSPVGSGSVPDQLVKLNMKQDVEAKNYKEIEKVEKLTPLEAKLRRIERLSQSIADGYVYMKKRGKEMQQTNASTNTRVLYLSIISMSSLSALAVWQALYLRRFFKAKKLID